MKKKVFCALLCTAMVASLTACGGSSSSTAADTSSDAAAEETTEAADDTAEADTADAAASEGGKIFGLYLYGRNQPVLRNSGRCNP